MALRKASFVCVKFLLDSKKFPRLHVNVTVLNLMYVFVLTQEKQEGQVKKTLYS